MKCSDCPAFEIYSNWDSEAKVKEMLEYEEKMFKQYGRLGICKIYTSPQRENDEMSCDESGELDQFILTCQRKIAWAERVINYIADRRKK